MNRKWLFLFGAIAGAFLAVLAVDAARTIREGERLISPLYRGRAFRGENPEEPRWVG